MDRVQASVEPSLVPTGEYGYGRVSEDTGPSRAAPGMGKNQAEFHKTLTVSCYNRYVVYPSNIPCKFLSTPCIYPLFRSSIFVLAPGTWN